MDDEIKFFHIKYRKEPTVSDKLKTFSVMYNTTTSSESVVVAKTKKEAIAKVREVIGEPIKIEQAWELKEKDS
ncbi:MAG: hypothetical protein V3U54_08420 [Thermodesulfobacteriota bacterium]